MPRTLTAPFPLQANKYVLGIDGCPEGWVAVSLPASGKISSVEARIYHTFDKLLEDYRNTAAAIMVDMPIGLMEFGRRPCETLTRKKLGKRASSVFASPRRPMLFMETYEEANAWGKKQGKESGGGLSKQAWYLLPKIKQIDLAITAKDQAVLGEAHPELAFLRINQGRPCRFPKKTIDGARERVALLQKQGIPDPREVFLELQKATAAKVRTDDVLDAIALALTARARLSGNAIHCFDGTHDQRNLKLEIWG